MTWALMGLRPVSCFGFSFTSGGIIRICSYKNHLIFRARLEKMREYARPETRLDVLVGLSTLEVLV
jgi:hypothetical protein